MSDQPDNPVGGERPVVATYGASSELVWALDRIANVLGGLPTESGGGADRFYDALGGAICSLTSIRRAVVFLWDEARRTVRVAGRHEIDVSVFDDDFVNLDLLPAARRALEGDQVVESTDHPVVAERYGDIVSNRALTVIPMVAGASWVGVVIGDRPTDAGPLSEAESRLLWSLGKTAALAATARSATRQAMRARELEARIDLAREIHERVVQRLFGVSLALSSEVELDAETRERCRTELQAALHELRDAVQKPLARSSRQTGARLVDELRRLSREHAALGLRLAGGDPADVPEHLEPLVQSVLVEAIRNVQKHAEPTVVDVTVARSDGMLVLEIANDGAVGRSGSSGMGLRLAAVEALQYGGLLEFGPDGEGRWKVRLAVPDDRA
ncbi:unannotated protein [freshwater metagenome]|uniref:Unannotated protein n=1 Tax=freshwater metagenome TaxID=449393 RepID=A0A6J7HMR1_9ZZZZ|nr:hypothetical protein [Actinomycetota bacterium]